MADLKAGANTVDAIYYGAVPILEVRRGTVKLWPPPVWSCNVTVGNYSGYPGYWYGGVGSIDKQPVPGQTLQGFYLQSSGLLVVRFGGNVSALLAGKRVFVDGINYGTGTTASWAYSAGGNFTFWAGEPRPDLVVGGSYLLAIK